MIRRHGKLTLLTLLLSASCSGIFAQEIPVTTPIDSLIREFGIRKYL